MIIVRATSGNSGVILSIIIYVVYMLLALYKPAVYYLRVVCGEI